MNTFRLLIIAALIGIFSKSLFAQDTKSQKYLNRALMAYEECLTSKTPGVVGSAIYNVIVMKSIYPDLDYTDLAKALDDLVVNAKAPGLRYKAQLASLYFEYPALFEGIEFEVSPENYDVFFRKISERIEAKPFAMN